MKENKLCWYAANKKHAQLNGIAIYLYFILEVLRP